MYETAEQLLRHNRDKLVTGVTIRPNWLDGGARFWYTVDGKQAIRVDPAAATPKTPFEPQPPAAGNPLEVPSPDGKHVVFRRDHNLWIRTGDVEAARTADGDADHDYGANPDYFMYSALLQKLGLPHAPIAVAWSPDSTKVLTHRTVQEGLRRTHLVESMPPDGGVPRLREMRTAFASDTHMPLAELVVVDVTTGEVVRARTEPLEMPILSPIMLGRAWWEGSSVYFLRQSPTTLTLNRLDPRTGEVTEVVSESGSTRVEPTQQPMSGPIVKILPGEVLWFSQRDGWGHLYRYDLRTGALINQVTSGVWVVQQILHITGGHVYFVAAGLVEQDPYRRSVCRAGLDGSGFEVLTPDDLDHAVTVSPDGSYFLDTSSTVDTPPVTVVRNWEGRVLVEVERADIRRLVETGWSPPERFRVKAADGNTDIYGVLYRPHDFDPHRRYPVLDHAYPLPLMTRVSPGFDPGWHGYDAEVMVALGFVVIAVDGRGTPGRGKQFHDHPFTDLSDHAAAITELAASRPWMDTSRVGVFGISAGGFAAVRALLDFPSVFTVGVSESGMHDWRFADPELARYVAGEVSNVDDAARLTGKLLLIHGGMDEQVSPHLTLRLVERLVAADKDCDMLLIPGAEHVYTGYEHFVNRRKWNFLIRNLHGTEPGDYRLAPVPAGAMSLPV